MSTETLTSQWQCIIGDQHGPRPVEHALGPLGEDVSRRPVSGSARTKWCTGVVVRGDSGG